MKFSTNEDILAPIDLVFASVSDFDSFERQALRHGAEISRQDNLDAPGVGMCWNGRFTFRGRKRDVTAEVAQYETPQAFTVASESGGLDGIIAVECIALAPHRTRLSVQVELKPRTIPARVVIQSLKLAKTSLNKRFKKRVADMAKNIEDKAVQT